MYILQAVGPYNKSADLQLLIHSVTEPLGSAGHIGKTHERRSELRSPCCWGSDLRYWLQQPKGERHYRNP